MEKPIFKNILQISGSGRNCGKTTVACHIINQLSKKGHVFGLKISPHFHIASNKQELVFSGSEYNIYRERDHKSGKDSSRMLNAGAHEVYFVQCDDKNIPDIYNKIIYIFPKNSPVVCESGSFANYYQIGILMVIQGPDTETPKRSYLVNIRKADIVIKTEEISPINFNYCVEFSLPNWNIVKIT